MTTFFRRPSRALAPFVELLWYVDEPMPDGLERRLPTGGMQIVVNLAEDELRWYDGGRLDVRHVASGAALSGPVARAIGIDTAEQRHSIGLAFRPGGGAPFFAPPAVELNEPLIGLDNLWGPPGGLVRERVLYEQNPAAMLETLERCLLEQVVSPLSPEPALDAAVAGLERGRRVRQVVEDTGTTPATLGRMFRRLVGISPKPYARVRRLQRVLASAARPLATPGVAGAGHSLGPDWTALAHDHGYFDQAHLINEFRALTGTTPTAYRPRSAGELNHLPIVR